MFNDKIALNDNYKTLDCDCKWMRKDIYRTQYSEKIQSSVMFLFVISVEITCYLRMKEVKDTIIKYHSDDDMF